uniref:Reverse transcriptase n=1 Tax=Chenopodium quinoa TaxID=63459 RepID=A0A803MIP1_CHEQI
MGSIMGDKKRCVGSKRKGGAKYKMKSNTNNSMEDVGQSEGELTVNEMVGMKRKLVDNMEVDGGEGEEEGERNKRGKIQGNIECVVLNLKVAKLIYLTKGNVVKWREVGMYGWPENVNKYKTWLLLNSLKQNAPGPLIYFGDFNEILSVNEKRGRALRSERCIDGFREAIDEVCVRDLQFKGGVYTWQRGLTMDTLVQERLDRFLATEEWCKLFPAYEVHHFPIMPKRSDHAPIILKEGVREENRRKKKIFKFESLWLSNPECERVVKASWKGDAMLSVPEKIASLSSDLGRWAGKSFGNIAKRMKIA